MFILASGEAFVGIDATAIDVGSKSHFVAIGQRFEDLGFTTN